MKNFIFCEVLLGYVGSNHLSFGMHICSRHIYAFRSALFSFIPLHKSHPGSSHPEVFLGKGVLKIYSKFTGEHPCRSVISKKLLCNFTKITLRHGCSPVNLLHIFRTPFPENTYGGVLLSLTIFRK